jgi:hypothetical protein
MTFLRFPAASLQLPQSPSVTRRRRGWSGSRPSPAQRHPLAGVFLECRAEGLNRLLQTLRPRLPLPQHPKCGAEVGLRLSPVQAPLRSGAPAPANATEPAPSAAPRTHPFTLETGESLPRAARCLVTPPAAADYPSEPIWTRGSSSCP